MGLTAIPTGVDMSGWGGDTTHYKVSDGTFLAVEVDNGAAPDEMLMENIRGAVGPRPIIQERRPTVIIACRANGSAVSLDRLHQFDPGTSAVEALTLAGYAVKK